ncbi:FAD-dependent oxidoreductase [Nonomuraea rhizosphaerae]|uniref:FAD-dependent oxidoreductase n=1 Tax=Nonomuraea rhizosphaerae TaxID=2665663 RepID=UPI001C605B4B|nr:FAD-dependent oxidoreductase [Nonomuraea rhizosphaerae]
MKVLVCGAGIAGLALAWHLERAGWDVEVVERAPAFRAGGYMIDFYGAGHEVMERMNLAGRLERSRYRVDELDYVNGDGRRTSRFFLPSSFTRVVSVLRGDLARTIADDVRAPVGYGLSVEAFSQNGHAVDVTLTDGTHRTVDLLVGADGTHSRVRDLLFGPEERHVRYLGHHVAACILTDRELNRQVGLRYRMLTVPGLMAGAYALRDDRLALLFLRREPDPELPADPAGALRRHYGEMGWILPSVLPRLPDDLYYDRVTQVRMDSWSRGRVVLLGDACQAVSLFAGHGASMAVAAAWVLAGELAGESLGESTGDGLSAALIRYERRMRPTIADVQALGRRFIEWMAPSSRLRISARDWLLRLASLPGAGNLFLSSLTPSGHDLICCSRRAQVSRKPGRRRRSSVRPYVQGEHPEPRRQMASPAAERGREVRRRLLAAAVELIPERGWTAVSTRILAERAGVAPGVVHYHFSSLTALLNEAAVGTMRQILAEATAVWDSAGTPAEAVDAMLASLKRYTGTDPASLLATEAYLAATRDDELREQIGGMVEEFRQQFGRWLDGHGVPDPYESAAVLAATLDGLLLHRGLGAGPDVSSMATVLHRLISR